MGNRSNYALKSMAQTRAGSKAARMVFSLNRQLERETAELRKSESKLGNSRFVENAPAAVVEQERERLAAYRGTVEKLRAQIRQLESLRA